MLNPLHDIIFLSCSFCILYRNNNITNKSFFLKERYFYVKIDTMKKSLNSDGKQLFLIFSKISPCTVLSTIINIKYYPELCNILMEWNILANSVIWLVNQAGDTSPYPRGRAWDMDRIFSVKWRLITASYFYSFWKINYNKKMLKTICLYGFFPHIRSNINFSVCKIRKARGIFRLQTSDFRLQTSDFRL
jgi:hypothetical protein